MKNNKLTPEHCLRRFEQCRTIIDGLLQTSDVDFTYPIPEPYKTWDDYAKFYIRNVEIYKAPIGTLKRKMPRKLKKSLHKK